MLIIDINNKSVHNEPGISPDVIALKGASASLTQSLINLVGTSPTNITSDSPHCCGAKATSACKKVPLANRPERISKTVPESVLAQSNGEFAAMFDQLGKILCGETTAPARSYRINQTLKVGKATRKTLQNQLAKLIVPHTNYVETLRGKIQGSNQLNPNSHIVTSRKTMAAIALYAYYSDDKSFTSTEACETIAKHVQVSPDLISRLATDLHVLDRRGFSTATRYSVNKDFGILLIRTLQNKSFLTLRAQADAVQNKIDALGSL